MSSSISPDELSYLKAIGEQEQATMTALRATRQSYETHLAVKYKLAPGDRVTADGVIERAPAAE